MNSSNLFLISIFIFLISFDAFSDCASPSAVAGQLQWISGVSKVQYCNGSSWVDTTATTGASCAGTTGGTINYSAGDLRYCNSTNWISMKGSSIASCAGITAGTYQWDSGLTKMKYCDGTNWYALGGAAATPTIDVLVIAGGGGGGRGILGGGGGGGAGGFCQQAGRAVVAGSTYTVTVGAGGAGGSGFSPTSLGSNGTNSVFDTITALGGGGGGAGDNQNGKNGGSGGGGAANYDVGDGIGGSSTQAASGGATCYGYVGGTWYYDANVLPGTTGGGAAGTPTGRSNSYSGAAVTYSTGGRAGSDGMTPETLGANGGANTGNGGEGGDAADTLPGESGSPGGSGIVIVRYPNTYPDATTTTGSPTFSNVGGYKIYKFTGSGSIKF